VKQLFVEGTDDSIDRETFVVDRTELSVDGMGFSVDGKGHSVDQTEFSVDQNEYSVDRNEFSVDGKEYSVDGKEFSMAVIRRWASEFARKGGLAAGAGKAARGCGFVLKWRSPRIDAWGGEAHRAARPPVSSFAHRH
jgi:hypothetical protein